MGLLKPHGGCCYLDDESLNLNDKNAGSPAFFYGRKRMRSLQDIDVKDKKVLMRLDLNVPIKEGKITSDARIQAALPTIKMALEKGGAVMIMAHLGRPVEGEYDESFSLAPVASYLSEALAQEVKLVKDYLDNAPQVQSGQVVLLENVRFNKGEKKNDAGLAKQYARLADVFVSDGFGVVHRAQASTHGVAEYVEIACAGPLVAKEVETLKSILLNPKRPMLAIVGGAKVSSKLLVLKAFIDKVDTLIPGGGIANTFMAAKGYNVGSSLYEPDLLNEAREMLALAKEKGVNVVLPVDVVVADEFSENAKTATKSIEDVAENEMILDVGPQTAELFARVIGQMQTIIWNGPVGVFEMKPFSQGTQRLAQAIAESEGFSFAGGGDTIAAINQFNIEDKVDYVSTGGGSMLEYIEGKTLPGLAVLED